MLARIFTRLLLLAVAVALMVWLQGCTTSRTASLQTDSVKVDSVLILERLRVDTITVPGDTITVEIPIECDSNFKVRPVVVSQRSKRSKSIIEVNNNMLKAAFNCDEYKQQITALEKQVNTLQRSQQSRAEVKIVTERYIPKWAWYALIFSCIVLTYWIVKYGTKLYLKIQSGGLF